MSGNNTFSKLLSLLFGVLFIVGVVLSNTSFAKDDLEIAVESWLNDRDDIAIPALARLAKSGNTDAQLLLGQLERRQGVYSYYLSGLDRKKRNAFLKAPGGLSGVSWLRVLEAENATAKALREAADPKFRLKGIEALLELGEAGPAVGPILEQIYFGEYATVAKLTEHSNFPEQARFVAWVAALNGGEGLGPKQRAALLVELGKAAFSNDLYGLFALSVLRVTPSSSRIPAIQDRAEMSGILSAYANERGSLKKLSATSLASEVDQLLLEDKSMKAVVGICAEECPESKRHCVQTLYFGLGGHMGLLSLQSPLERMIPRHVYFNSERHVSEIKRTAFVTFDVSWGAKARKFSKTTIGREADQCILESVQKSVEATQ